MKKIATLILVLLLAVPSAFAGNLPIGGGLKATPTPEATETPEPTETPAPEAGDVLSDPMARYQDFADPTDPASVWFLRMLDSVNDEAALAPAGMAVKREDFTVDADGGEALKSTMYLYDTDYGRVLEIVNDAAYPGMVVYVFPDAVAILYGGMAATDAGGYEADTSLPAPERFLNAYDPAETLLAVRAEGDGYAYLTDSGAGMLFEYLTDASLNFFEMRSYEAGADGAMRLTQYALVEIVEAPALPDAVQQAMEAKE